MKGSLIGASTIASEHVIGAMRAIGHEVVSVLSSDLARGADYAARHGIARSSTDLAALLVDLEVDAEAHESFTHRFAGSGVEVHGSEDSVFGRRIMTQRPVGEATLVDGSRQQSIRFEAHDLYAQSIGLFAGAAAGRGRPAADGVDGVKSPAVALAAREAARQGRAVKVNYGGI